MSKNGGTVIMDIAEKLKTDKHFDPSAVFGRTSKEQLLHSVSEILTNEEEFSQLIKDEQFRGNLLKLVNLVYLRLLHDASLDQKERRSLLLDEPSTQKILQLADQH
jgi:hypothetical protein